MLHAALREKLGKHVSQKGSYVGPDRLRFDFSHSKPISHQEIVELNKNVNAVVINGGEVKTRLMTPKKAIEQGAMALFGEKYGDEVRVVTMGNFNNKTFSIELCGGTHATELSTIGNFEIINESSIASGVRRIEALRGDELSAYKQSLNKLAKEKEASLNSQIQDLETNIKKLNGNLEDLKDFSPEAKVVKLRSLYESLYKKLSKSKLFNRVLIKDKFFYDKLLKNDNYDLIINCNQENPISKKYFIKKIYKDYKNLAYTTILEHKKLKNDSAIQVFTDLGPIAFLPISSTKTSVVFSIDIENKSYNDTEILDLIKKYNPKYKIKKILGLSNFELNSSNLRNYYHKNILAFGDLLHRIHPLAGQGFNMIIRDIKNLSKIIQNKIELGIQLDSIILEEFERKTKNSNFIFSNGIDFIYEIFNNDKKNKNQNLNKALRILGRNEKLMNSIIRYADSGLNI